MTMPTSEENIDGYEGDPPTPVLSPPTMMEKKKRGRPKGTGTPKKSSKYGRMLLPKKRGRKPKSLFSSPMVSMNSEMPCTPPPQSPSPSSPVPFETDEFFNNDPSDLLNYDDENPFNDVDFGIEQPFDDNGEMDSTAMSSDMSNELDGSTGSHEGELKVRLKVSSMYSAAAQKKRGRRPKKTNKLKIVKENYEKRKYTKRKMPRDAEDTSNLRRSTRPPQASKAFDDHYLL